MTDLFGNDGGPEAGSLLYRHNQRMGAYARNADPPQSHVAAAKVDVNRLEGLVVSVLRTHGPLTVKQIARRSLVDKWSISPRMKPLETKGLVRRFDKVGKEIIWQVTPLPFFR